MPQNDKDRIIVDLPELSYSSNEAEVVGGLDPSLSGVFERGAPTALFPGTTEVFFDKGVWNVRLSGGGLNAPMRFQPGKDSSNAKNLRKLAYELLLEMHLDTFTASLQQRFPGPGDIVARRAHDLLLVEVYGEADQPIAEIQAVLQSRDKTPELLLQMCVMEADAPADLGHGVPSVIAGHLSFLMHQYLPHCAGASVRLVGDGVGTPDASLRQISLSESLPSGVVKIEVARGVAAGTVGLAMLADQPIAAGAVLIADRDPVLLAENLAPFEAVNDHLMRALALRGLAIQDLTRLELDTHRSRNVEGGVTLWLDINSTQRIGTLGVHFAHRDELVKALVCLDDDQVMVQLISTTQLMIKEVLQGYLASMLRSLGWGATQVRLVQQLPIKLGQTFTDGYDPTNERGLFQPDLTCHHQLVSAPGGGVKCTKCPGWHCA